MQTPIATGDSRDPEFTVTDEDTALSLGSGDLAVLATRGCSPGARPPPVRPWRARSPTADQRRHPRAARARRGQRGGRLGPGHRDRGYVDGRLVRFEVVAEQAPDDKVVGTAR